MIDTAFHSSMFPNSTGSSIAVGALAVSLTTALAALTKSGRYMLLRLPASAYVRLFHDRVPTSDDKQGLHPTTTCQSDSEPVAVLGKDDERVSHISHSVAARVFKAVFGTPDAEKQAQAGLDGKAAEGSAPWVRICDFAAEADPAVWIMEEELDGWRRLGDDPADHALDVLRQAQDLIPNFQPHSPADPLADLFDLDKQCSTATSSPSSPSALRDNLHGFVDNVSQRPPRGAGAISEAWYAARDQRRAAKGLSPADPLTQDELEEEYVEEARVLRAAQQMFYKFVGPILLSLLHFSLAGGFSSPKIMSVLRQTGYLVPYRDATSASTSSSSSGSDQGPAKKLSPVERAAMQSQRTADRTWDRLLETTQFVLDVVQDVDALLPPALFSDAHVRGLYPQEDPQGRKDKGSTADSHSLHVINDEQRNYLERIGGGRGWQSAVRVRLLHANVRHKIRASVRARQARSATMFDAADDEKHERGAGAAHGVAHARLYDEALNGVPINQEDLLATLASFSTSPLYCLGRMGHHVTDEEREDYVALWRHVGYYMGCEPALLRRCFGDARTADRFLFNVVGHLFPNISEHVRREPEPQPQSEHAEDEHVRSAAAAAAEAQEHDTLASLAILQAVAFRPPFHTSLHTHWALARHLLGPSLAGYLGIPHTTPLQQVSVDLSFLATRITILFGSPHNLLARLAPYPAPARARWEHERLRLGRIMMRRLICWLYGSKLATFAGRVGAGAGAGGGAEVRVELDARQGKAYARAWRVLMLQMVAVLVGWGLVGVVAVRALFTLR